MYNDVIDLREFYETSLGQVARRLIRRRIREFWPDVTGQRVLGIGYATPYLRPFRGEAERVMSIMPAAQGVVFWPPEGPSLVALSEESELPLPDMSVDRVLLVHSLECTEQMQLLMREIWRVLAGGGRLIAVVPNRRGIWARSDRTPFGHGSPFSSSQIKRTLRSNQFIPEREACALFIPPAASRFLMAWAGAWEEVGSRWFTTFAGVHMVEASKQIYANAGPVKARRRQRNRLLAPSGVPAFNRTRG